MMKQLLSLSKTRNRDRQWELRHLIEQQQFILKQRYKSDGHPEGNFACYLFWVKTREYHSQELDTKKQIINKNWMERRSCMWWSSQSSVVSQFVFFSCVQKNNSFPLSSLLWCCHPLLKLLPSLFASLGNRAVNGSVDTF